MKVRVSNRGLAKQLLLAIRFVNQLAKIGVGFRVSISVTGLSKHGVEIETSKFTHTLDYK